MEVKDVIKANSERQEVEQEIVPIVPTKSEPTPVSPKPEIAPSKAASAPVLPKPKSIPSKPKSIQEILIEKLPKLESIEATLNSINDEIRPLERQRANLEIERDDCKGLFAKKKRLELQVQIDRLNSEITAKTRGLTEYLNQNRYDNFVFHTDLITAKKAYDEKRWQSLNDYDRDARNESMDKNEYRIVRDLERGR